MTDSEPTRRIERGVEVEVERILGMVAGLKARLDDLENRLRRPLYERGVVVKLEQQVAVLQQRVDDQHAVINLHSKLFDAQIEAMEALKEFMTEVRAIVGRREDWEEFGRKYPPGPA